MHIFERLFRVFGATCQLHCTCVRVRHTHTHVRTHNMEWDLCHAYHTPLTRILVLHNEIFFSESGPYTIRNELFTGFLQTFLHSLIHPRMAKGPIWSVGYNPNQTVYGPDAVCTTERKHVVKPLYGSCSKCTCYVYKMFSNSLYNAVHIITKRCHCPVM